MNLGGSVTFIQAGLTSGDVADGPLLILVVRYGIADSLHGWLFLLAQIAVQVAPASPGDVFLRYLAGH